MDKKNIFENAANRRKKEMEAVETVVTSERDDLQEKRTTMSIAMSVKEKTMLKQYAAAQGKTTASIVQGWIREFCRNQ